MALNLKSLNASARFAGAITRRITRKFTADVSFQGSLVTTVTRGGVVPTAGTMRLARLLNPGALVELFIIDLTALSGPVLYYTNSTAPGGRVVTDGHTTSGSANITSTNANFSTADIGLIVSGPGIYPNASIVSVNPGSHQATLSGNSTATASSQTLVIGSGVRVFQGLSYQPWPIMGDAWDINTKGTLPRPLVTVSNIGGAVTALLQQYNDFVGATVSRKRTYSQFLDGYATANPSEEYPIDVFVVTQKKAENNMQIQFELATKADSEGKMLPGRQIIANACQWLYRGPDCGYADVPVTDQFGNLFGTTNVRGAYNSATTYSLGDSVYTLSNELRVYWVSLKNSNTDALTVATSWKMDVCNKQLSDCKLHFGATNPLPTSAFPGSNQIVAG